MKSHDLFLGAFRGNTWSQKHLIIFSSQRIHDRFIARQNSVAKSALENRFTVETVVAPLIQELTEYKKKFSATPMTVFSAVCRRWHTFAYNLLYEEKNRRQ